MNSPQTTDLDQKHQRTLNQCQKKRKKLADLLSCLAKKLEKKDDFGGRNKRFLSRNYQLTEGTEAKERQSDNRIGRRTDLNPDQRFPR